MPNYAFNAKELDEENNMYYYSARYYAPPTFISRDPMFEIRPWMSPYAYCSNSPINRIDPTGLFDTKEEAVAYKKENHIRGRVKHDGESWTIYDKKNKVSYYKDNSNTPMAGKDENGIVKSVTIVGRKTFSQSLKDGINWFHRFGEGKEAFSSKKEPPSREAPFSNPRFTQLKEWIDKLFGKQDPTPTPQPKLEPELIQNGNVFEYTINRTGEKKQVIITDPKDSATMRKWWKGWVTVDTIYPNMRPKE